MKLIKIDASPKQLSKLRNGHKVRVKQAIEGQGFGMIVDPAKFDQMTRSFTKGSAVQLQLSPDELMANKQAVMNGEIEGQGIYTGGRGLPGIGSISSVFKKAGSAIKDVANKAVKGAKKAAPKIIKEVKKAEKAVRKNPTSRMIVKKVLPLVAQKATEGLLTYAGADPSVAKEVGNISKEGTTSGLSEAGYGLYAGRGLYAGGALPGPPSRMPEKSSLAIGGTLLASSNRELPPALRSDAMSANFHMNVQLPPHLQRGGVRFV